MSGPLHVGLTGSIGMGKSTTAEMFQKCGLPVWDADAAVHALYGPQGCGSALIAQIAPDTVDFNGVNRPALRDEIVKNPDLMKRVEAIVHPLVAKDRLNFSTTNHGVPVLVYDIPLLYEIGADATLDKVVVVTASAEVQRARVLERPGMTLEALEDLLMRQLPDAEKRSRADYIVETDKGLEAAQVGVKTIVRELIEAASDA